MPWCDLLESKMASRELTIKKAASTETALLTNKLTNQPYEKEN
jgi:hypothetical protein